MSRNANKPLDLAAIQKDHLFYHLPGNFYYYALFNTTGGYASIEHTEALNLTTTEVTGYHLFGYGNSTNAGQDVYNIFGDLAENSLGTITNYEVDEMGNVDFRMGQDGRKDGVIIIVSSGSPNSPGILLDNP